MLVISSRDNKSFSDINKIVNACNGDDMSLKDKAKKLKRDIPAVFLALKRKDTPILAKIFGAVTVGYALSPINLIPDFVPGLGYLDDVILLPLLVTLTLKFIPKNIFDECRQQSEGMWDYGKPKKWYYAIPIVFVWGLLIWGIVKMFV